MDPKLIVWTDIFPECLYLFRLMFRVWHDPAIAIVSPTSLVTAIFAVKFEYNTGANMLPGNTTSDVIQS